MSISKTFLRGLAAAAGALAMAGVAHADTTWDITGTFNDGGSLTGTVTLNTYDYLSNNFTITTTKGTAESGFTYTAADSYYSNSTPGSSPFYIDFQPQYFADLHIDFQNDLGVAAPTDIVIGGYQSFECVNSYSCPAAGSSDDYAIRYFTGMATYVPEPASSALMIVGLGAIGAALRSSRRKSAIVAA